MEMFKIKYYKRCNLKGVHIITLLTSKILALTIDSSLKINFAR